MVSAFVVLVVASNAVVHALVVPGATRKISRRTEVRCYGASEEKEPKGKRMATKRWASAVSIEEFPWSLSESRPVVASETDDLTLAFLFERPLQSLLAISAVGGALCSSACAARWALSRCPPPTTALHAYNRALATRPFATKAVGTGVTYLASDLTAQAFEGEAMTLHGRLARAFKFSAVGAFWVGPLLAAWFQGMDALLPGRTPLRVASKIVIDQCVQGPFMIASMFILTGLAAGKRAEDIRETLRDMLKPTWMKSVYVWSPVQAVQQLFVPLEYRVAAANFVSYFWDTYLAAVMAPPTPKKAAAPSPRQVPRARPASSRDWDSEFD